MLIIETLTTTVARMVHTNLILAYKVSANEIREIIAQYARALSSKIGRIKQLPDATHVSKSTTMSRQRNARRRIKQIDGKADHDDNEQRLFLPCVFNFAHQRRGPAKKERDSDNNGDGNC